MCGIVGALSFDGPIDVELVAAMRDRMVHRGPDGAGLWASADRRTVLGHRRLSIIDLAEAASQPMSNEDGSIQIVFNGEIYNHAEIKRELERTGRHRWRTDHADTEVILHAYEEWGIDCVSRFRGMFAIALWDGRERRLWLVRDRIGIKPIYYARVGSRFYFASEIKALLAAPGMPRRINIEGLYHYLSFLTVPAPDTLFAGIQKLPPATRMTVRLDGSTATDRYWDVWDRVVPLVDVPESSLAERILDELRTAVRYRKVSDVPVGVFLSGGIDSTTNAALFAEGGDRVKTFSIGYDAQYASYADELPYAERAARFVGAESHVRRLTQDDLLSFMPAMVYHQDEPIGDVVCVPLYYVSRLARDHGVIVCQVGEGSDELFCGYPLWRKHLNVAALNGLPVPRLAKRLGLGVIKMAGGRYGYPAELLRRAAAGEPTFWGGAEGLTHAEKQLIIAGELRANCLGHSSAEALTPIRRRFESKAWERSDLHWMTYLDLSFRLPELLLMRVDKMTMATSLEGRVPFLDHHFVELVMSIPTAAKIGDGTLKHLLKRAVRGVIPDEMIDRRKQGFGVPLQDWLFDRLGSEVSGAVRRFCQRTGLLDWSAVEPYLSGAKASKAWQLLNLALWFDCYLDGRETEFAQAAEAFRPAALAEG